MPISIVKRYPDDPSDIVVTVDKEGFRRLVRFTSFVARAPIKGGELKLKSSWRGVGRSYGPINRFIARIGIYEAKKKLDFNVELDSRDMRNNAQFQDALMDGVETLMRIGSTTAKVSPAPENLDALGGTLMRAFSKLGDQEVFQELLASNVFDADSIALLQNPATRQQVIHLLTGMARTAIS